MELLNDDIDVKEQLQCKLDSLRRNEQNISREELEGKYKKAYQTLLNEIAELSGKLMDEIMFRFLVEKQFVEEGHKLVLDLYKKNEKKLTLALRKEYSAGKYAEICQGMYEVIINRYFEQWSPDMAKEEEKFTLNPWQTVSFTIKTE